MSMKEAVLGAPVKDGSTGGRQYAGSSQAWLPIKNVINGVVVTRDHRFIKIVEVLAQGEPVAYPLRKGPETETLLAAINEILENARQDGSLAAISEKYLGADLTHGE